MAIRAKDFHQIIYLCDSYLAVPNVDVPNFYGQLREIQCEAHTADSADETTLSRLVAQTERVWYLLTPAQRDTFNAHFSSAERRRIEENRS